MPPQINHRSGASNDNAVQILVIAVGVLFFVGIAFVF